MPTFTALGASIEGQALRLQSRSPIQPLAPVVHESLGSLFQFRMTQSSEAEVTAELDPLRWVYCETSALRLGDMLRAARISGVCKKPLGRARLIQGSSAHKAMQCESSSYSHARIDVPLRNVLESGRGLMSPGIDPEIARPAPIRR